MGRGLGIHLTFEAVLLIQLVTTLAVAAPQLQAYVGMFHLGAMTGARLMGIAPGPAGALAITMWTVNVFPVTMVGLGLLWKSGWSLGQLARESRSATFEDEGET